MPRLLVGLCLIFTLALAQAQNSAFVAQFDPAAGILPTPNNLLFSNSTDGTLNIPISDPTDPRSALLEALNALDGFSTVAPASVTFSAAVDPDSLIAGETVRLFEVELVNPFLNPSTATPFQVTDIKAELIGEQDFSVDLAALDPEQRTLVITPLRPLKAKSGYLVILTDGIRSATDGASAIPDLTYIFARYRGEALIDESGQSRFASLSDTQAQTLEPLRQLVVSQEDAAAAFGIQRGTIVLSWSFMTQSVDDALHALHTHSTPQTITLTATGTNTSTLGLPGLADIHVGALQIPYYLEAPTLIPTVILTTYWQTLNGVAVTRYTPLAVATQTLTIPLLATIPNGASGHSKPIDGWPVVVFAHGITQNRTNLLAIADALAAAGLAAIAIDLPLHGVTDPANPFYQAAMERTFNVDLINNETGTPGADGLIDPSGAHFINFNSLLTGRDNLRQGAIDLLNLLTSLGTADSDNDGNADFDITQVHFVGHSLGAMVGTVMLGIEERLVASATLAVPGGGIPRLLNGSPSYGPLIRAGLAAAGIVEGTPEFEAFLDAAQQALDSADPINYGQIAADEHPIHMIEVVGPPPDQIVPNTVVDAPLSGTEPLARAMGLLPIDMTAIAENGIRGIVRFTEGAHSSLLSPSASAAATLEMQTQTAGFAASDGTVLPIADPGVIQPAP